MDFGQTVSLEVPSSDVASSLYKLNVDVFGGSAVLLDGLQGTATTALQRGFAGSLLPRLVAVRMLARALEERIRL